jgi:hypothetical protein
VHQPSLLDPLRLLRLRSSRRGNPSGPKSRAGAPSRQLTPSHRPPPLLATAAAAAATTAASVAGALLLVASWLASGKKRSGKRQSALPHRNPRPTNDKGGAVAVSSDTDAGGGDDGSSTSKESNGTSNDSAMGPSPAADAHAAPAHTSSPPFPASRLAVASRVA